MVALESLMTGKQFELFQEKGRFEESSPRSDGDGCSGITDD